MWFACVYMMTVDRNEDYAQYITIQGDTDIHMFKVIYNFGDQVPFSI